uniref:Uncharacterized protein n=1 Tax=Moniliophthora roreri TaxID=221103 RepID=A0A0W0FEV3_MONRR
MNHVQSAKACFNKEDEKTKEHVQKGAEKAYQQWKTAYEKTLNNDSLLKEDQVDGGCIKTYVSLMVVEYNKDGDKDKAFFCNILLGAMPSAELKKFHG